MAGMSMEEMGDVVKQASVAIEALREALLVALPYVTDAEDSPDFKAGKVSAHVKQIRAALKLVGVE